jgi:hypothetical protein
MPIVLGNTSISGLASGGLPSSVISDSNIGYAGAIIGVTNYQSSTRIVTSASANVTYYSFTVTKKRTNSILVAHGVTPIGGGSDNHGIYWFVDFGGSRVFRGIVDGWRYHNETMPGSSPGMIRFNTSSPTGIAAGSVTVGFGIQPISGGANRPWYVLNPTSSDDGRNRTGTTVTVYEVAT